MVRIDGGSHIPHYNPNRDVGVNATPMSDDMEKKVKQMFALWQDFKNNHINIDKSKSDADYLRSQAEQLIKLTSDLKDLLRHLELSDKEPVYIAVMKQVNVLNEVAKQMGHDGGIQTEDQRRDMESRMHTAIAELANYCPHWP